MSHRSVPKWSVAGKMIGRLRDAEAKCDWFNWGDEENSNELQKSQLQISFQTHYVLIWQKRSVSHPSIVSWS